MAFLTTEGYAHVPTLGFKKNRLIRNRDLHLVPEAKETGTRTRNQVGSGRVENFTLCRSLIRKRISF